MTAHSLRAELDLLQRQPHMKMWLESLDRLRADTRVNARLHRSKSLNWICLAVQLWAFSGIQLTRKNRQQDVDAGVWVVHSPLYSVQTRLASSTGTDVSPNEDQQTSSVRYKDCICDSKISVTRFFPPICWVGVAAGLVQIIKQKCTFLSEYKKTLVWMHCFPTETHSGRCSERRLKTSISAFLQGKTMLLCGHTVNLRCLYN